ncbi:hypothetical protein MNBD_CHLOROFLEXI01-4807, partial [hydrothermal vent metagenome]
QLVAEQWIEQLVELLKANELGRYRGVVCLLQVLGFLQDHHFAAAYVAAKDGLTAVLQATPLQIQLSKSACPTVSELLQYG